MHADLVLTTLGTAVLLGAVYGSRPQRAQNQAFTVLGLAGLGWLVAIQLAFAGEDPRRVAFWISTCAAFASFIPPSLHLLRATIRGATFRQALRRQAGWFWAGVAFAVYCYTPLYIAGVSLPEDPGLIPEHLPGSLFVVYPLYLLGGMVAALVLSGVDAVRLRGVARVESAFLAAATAAMVLIGLILSNLLPYFVGTFQSTRYSYIWLVSMLAIAAYGISANQLLAPGRLLQRLCVYGMVAALVGGLYLAVRLGGELLLGHHTPEVLVLIPGVAAAVGLALFGSRGLAWARHLASLLERRLNAPRILRRLNLAQAPVGSLRDFAAVVEGVLAVETGAMAVVLLVRGEDGGLRGARSPESDSVPAGDLLTAAWERARHPLTPAGLRRGGAEAAARAMESRGWVLLVPVVGEAGADGALAFAARYSGLAFTAGETEDLGLLAAQLAVALRNARLFSEVERQRDQSERLAESINLALVACAHDGRIVQYNRRARDILSGARGPTLDDLPPELAEPLRAALEGRAQRRRRIEVFGRHFLADTGRYDDRDDRPLGAFLILEDVSDRVALERRLGQVADQAHDLKVPMSALRLFAELLPANFDDRAFRDEFAPAIVEEIRRLNAIVGHLTAGRAGEAPAVDLATVIQEEIERLRPQARARGIRLEMDVTGDAFPVPLAETDARRLVANPVQNALEAIGESGTGTVVRVRLAREAGGVVVLEVDDDGPGVPAELRETVFRDGFTTRGERGGSGIGLAQVAVIAAKAGASVSLEPGPNGGTRLCWRLRPEPTAAPRDGDR